MNKTFDDLTPQEKVEAIYEMAYRIAEAAKPIFERLTQAMLMFSKAMNGPVEKSFSDEFMRKFMVDTKKERNRKRYYRMMSRRK